MRSYRAAARRRPAAGIVNHMLGHVLFGIFGSTDGTIRDIHDVTIEAARQFYRVVDGCDPAELAYEYHDVSNMRPTDRNHRYYLLAVQNICRFELAAISVRL